MSIAGHAELMDGVYRHQRHFYDLTRKYYLLGRDRLIERLNAPAGASVLELGCGTGRNLLQAAKRFPQAEFGGLDISREMLETAAASIEKRALAARIKLVQGDATDFDTQALFGRTGFDRVFISYSLSMIPDWRRTVTAALDALDEGGSLHIVDFGRQENLPGWFRRGLRAWLAKFHVAPRDSLRELLEAESHRIGAELQFTSLYRGYSVHAIVTRR